MKKIQQSIPFILVLQTFIYSLAHLYEVKQITESTFLSVTQLFYSLFFLMVLFGVMNDMGLFAKGGKLLIRFLGPFLHLNEMESAIYLASIFSGYPTFAKMIKEAYVTSQISQESADHLLKICSHGSIGFMVGVLGPTLFHDPFQGWMLFLIQVFANLIIAILTRPRIPHSKPQVVHPSLSLMASLPKQFKSCLEVFVYIYGYMLIFNIFNHAVFLDHPITHGFLEFSQGCLNLYALTFTQKMIACSFFISFSSLSVLFQVYAVIADTDLTYRKYLFARLIQSFIAIILTWFYLSL